MPDILDIINRIKQADEQDPRRLEFDERDAATEAEVEEAERTLGVRFPDDLRVALMSIGSGGLAYTMLYGIKPTDHPSMVTINGSPLQPHHDYVAFSDNGAGDYFGFERQADSLGTEVILLDHETGERRAVYDSFTAWLAREAFLA